MTQYIILKNQGAEGCDYTIACGKDYEFREESLNIDEMEELLAKELFAYSEARDMTIEEVATCCRMEKSERWLEELIIISVEAKEVRHVDTDAWFEKFVAIKESMEEELAAVESKNKDMEDLERLKKLYPDQFK